MKIEYNADVFIVETYIKNKFSLILYVYNGLSFDYFTFKENH